MNEREKVCLDHFESAKRINGLVDGLTPLFYIGVLGDIWRSLEALLGWRFPAVNCLEMRKKLVGRYQTNFASWSKSDRYTASISKLFERRRIENMQSGKYVYLENVDDLLQVLNFSYAAWKNYDHGAKLLVGDSQAAKDNRALVENSAKVTYEILESVLCEEKLR